MMSVFEQKMLQKFKKLLEQPGIEIKDVPGSVEYPVNGYKLIHKIIVNTECKTEQILFIEREGMSGTCRSIKITNLDTDLNKELSKEFKQLLVDMIHDKYIKDEKKKRAEEAVKNRQKNQQKVLDYLDSFISAGLESR